MAGSEGAPIEQSAGWDVYSIATSDDPHGRWRRIRETAPVLDAGEGVYLLTRFADVDAILRDPRHGAGAGVSASFGATGGLGYEVMHAWLMSLDGPAQTRARGLVRRPFSPSRVESLAPLIRKTAEALAQPIERRPAGEVVDLVSTFCFPLPSTVIRSLFGLDTEEWAAEVEPLLRADDPRPDAGLEMIEGLARFFGRVLERGPAPPGLLRQLAEEDAEHGRLSSREIVANAVLLVTAGIDTTAALIGNTIHLLLERPELLGRVRRTPALVAGAIEETLRFEPPALSCSRTAGVDLVVHGVEIPAGSQLLLSIAAASRDPAHYVEPDRFDPERDATGSLAFGGGRHFCLGAALARLEARLAVERLLVDSPVGWSATEPPRWQRRSPTVRALERLPVRIEPRADDAAPRT